MNKVESIKKHLNSLELDPDQSFEVDFEKLSAEYKQKEDNESSLAIKILSIFGGLFSTFLFLGFLAITGIYNSEEALLFSGVLFIAVAIGLNISFDKLLIDTFSIAIYIAGFVLLGIGIMELGANENTVVSIFISMALLTLAVTQNYMLSFIATLTISTSILALILFNNHNQLVTFYIAINILILVFWFLKEAKIVTAHYKLSKLYLPIRIGLFCSVILNFAFTIVSRKGWYGAPIDSMWLPSLVIIPSILLVVHKVIAIRQLEKQQVKIFALTCLLLVPTVFTPSIAAAMLLVLISFLVHYRTGWVMGIVCLVYAVSQYYYDLHFTLLVKSFILMASGLLFLVLYYFIKKSTEGHEKI